LIVGILNDEEQQKKMEKEGQYWKIQRPVRGADVGGYSTLTTVGAVISR